jgi:hypothetical protein
MAPAIIAWVITISTSGTNKPMQQVQPLFLSGEKNLFDVTS